MMHTRPILLILSMVGALGVATAAAFVQVAPDGRSCRSDEDCDDAVACTEDSCRQGTCRHSPVDAMCDDFAECSQDHCDPAAGCLNEPRDDFCDNGVFCDGAETCHTFVGCLPGPPPCGLRGCDEFARLCTPCPECEDLNPCTVDGCDPDTNLCAHVPGPDAGCTSDNDCPVEQFCADCRCTESGGDDDDDDESGPNDPEGDDDDEHAMSTHILKPGP